MVVIIGKTASGKDIVVKELVSKHGYKKVITYCTRPQRKGEKQNTTYHFISDEEFKHKIDEEFFAEYKVYDTKFGTWYYGSALEDIENADEKSVIILTPQGYRDIKDKFPNKNITCIYIYANNTTLKDRLAKRKDDPKEADRRLKNDMEDFKGFESEADRIVYNNNGEKISNVVDKILDFIKTNERK